MSSQLLPLNSYPNSGSQFLPSSSLCAPETKEIDCHSTPCFHSPLINPASAHLCRYFHSVLKTSAPDSHIALCTRLAPDLMPLSLKTPLPSPPVRTHLPMGALAQLTLTLQAALSYTPLICSAPLAELQPLPSNERMANDSWALRRKA